MSGAVPGGEIGLNIQRARLVSVDREVFMTKLRNACFALAMLQAGAIAADPGLLSMVMPDAKVVAGVQVDSARNSPFGQYVLAHMQPDDASFKKFIADTGFDPRRDLTEIVMASNWENNSPADRFVVMARGAFNPSRIKALVEANGGSAVSFQGVDILLPNSKQPAGAAATGFAFPDTSTALMGDVASLKAAIQRKQSNAVASSTLLGKVHDLSPKNDFWFVTLVPLSEFSSAMPNPNLQGAMNGNLMQAISQASGGVQFRDPVVISGEAVTRSDKDAEALADVVRFVVGLIQQNRGNGATAGQVSDLLDALNLTTSGNVMTMSLAIPEKQLEQIFDTARTGQHQARKKNPPAN